MHAVGASHPLMSAYLQVDRLLHLQLGLDWLRLVRGFDTAPHLRLGDVITVFDPRQRPHLLLRRWRLGPRFRLLAVWDVTLGRQKVECPRAVWTLLGFRESGLLHPRRRV